MPAEEGLHLMIGKALPLIRLVDRGRPAKEENR